MCLALLKMIFNGLLALRRGNNGEEIRRRPAGARRVVGRYQFIPGVTICLTWAAFDDEYLGIKSNKQRIAA